MLYLIYTFLLEHAFGVVAEAYFQSGDIAAKSCRQGLIADSISDRERAGSFVKQKHK